MRDFDYIVIFNIDKSKKTGYNIGVSLFLEKGVQRGGLLPW